MGVQRTDLLHEALLWSVLLFGRRVAGDEERMYDDEARAKIDNDARTTVGRQVKPIPHDVLVLLKYLVDVAKDRFGARRQVPIQLRLDVFGLADSERALDNFVRLPRGLGGEPSCG